jgi:hypothetical protein
MKLKHVKPIIASAMLAATSASFANTVNLVNASPTNKGILGLKYQLAYKKDFGHPPIFGQKGKVTLQKGKSFNITIPQKEGYKLSGIVVKAARVEVHQKRQWEAMPHRFAHLGNCSMATDKNHPDGILKFKLKYSSKRHGELSAEQIGGNNQ